MAIEDYYSQQSSQVGGFPEWTSEKKPKDQLSPESLAMSLAQYATQAAADPFSGLSNLLNNGVGLQTDGGGAGGGTGGSSVGTDYTGAGGMGLLDAISGGASAIGVGKNIYSGVEKLVNMLTPTPMAPLSTAEAWLGPVTQPTVPTTPPATGGEEPWVWPQTEQPPVAPVSGISTIAPLAGTPEAIAAESPFLYGSGAAPGEIAEGAIAAGAGAAGGGLAGTLATEMAGMVNAGVGSVLPGAVSYGTGAAAAGEAAGAGAAGTAGLAGALPGMVAAAIPATGFALANLADQQWEWNDNPDQEEAVRIWFTEGPTGSSGAPQRVQDALSALENNAALWENGGYEAFTNTPGGDVATPFTDYRQTPTGAQNYRYLVPEALGPEGESVATGALSLLGYGPYIQQLQARIDAAKARLAAQMTPTLYETMAAGWQPQEAGWTPNLNMD